MDLESERLVELESGRIVGRSLNIKALVVTLSSNFINIDVFSFPIDDVYIIYVVYCFSA